MSFSDTRGLTWAQKLGCLGVFLVGAIVSLIALLVAALRRCLPEVGGHGCEARTVPDFVLFPGVPTLFLILGIGMIWFFHHRNDQR